MKKGGGLVGMCGWLVGTGPGAGFGLLILICATGGTLIGLSGYLVKEIRDLGDDMPDYHPLPPVGLVRRMKPAFAVNTESLADGSLEDNLNSNTEKRQKDT